MNYVNKLKHIDFQSIIEFQKFFAYEENGRTVYTPFEYIEDPEIFFPQSIVGELGSLINYYCKTKKKRAFYTSELLDEAADLFIYFLVYMMILDSGEHKLLGALETSWNTKTALLTSESEFNQKIQELVTTIFTPSGNIGVEWVNYVFKNIQSIACFTTSRSWQDIIDRWHLSRPSVKLVFPILRRM